MTAAAHPRAVPRARATLAARVEETLAALDGPDVVVAVSRDGERTVATGGHGPRTAGQRTRLRYEIGSATKTYTGLLLADLACSGRLGADDPVRAHLPPLPGAHRRQTALTLTHLATHTAGLPRLPHDATFYRQAVPHRHTNPYARYDTGLLLDAFARARTRHAPGTRWHYSSFGLAVLGQALAHTSGTSYTDLLTDRVLAPLGLPGTGLHPSVAGRDAEGHRGAGGGAVPPLEMSGFAPAGAVRATPHDLLAYLEAHLHPGRTPLADALRAVRVPRLVRGVVRRRTHTLAWFQHPGECGPVLFHGGATPGQEAFLGFSPATGTAVAVLATRPWTSRSPLGALAYDLLTTPPDV
ncbi:serine hydrolase domain-containing protein [Streptomyces sp. TRM 70351]|uniref:serine hydrolase domain-containing protein n=1 Tax=Streptomyces sp. TRM 70351 TaxID=3116552 RepID=UPI002E7C427A|nr:serine hydrolase domain-containing protein [Streptomyces sp. TRM 70351]MEE1929631.1 serine hydrolase domain-containing protein [Streptomyces sp. TRM 70351]